MHKRRSNQQEMCCKKHPKHRQGPGVCSRCLGEKLSKISSSSRRSSVVANYSSSSSSSLSSLSSYYSSSDASYASSPIRFFGGRSKNVVGKSKSMPFDACMRGEEGGEGEKKSGFWSKLQLLGGRSKKTNQALLQSRTMREIH